jgi:hypothetical protein
MLVVYLFWGSFFLFLLFQQKRIMQLPKFIQYHKKKCDKNQIGIKLKASLTEKLFFVVVVY